MRSPVTGCSNASRSACRNWRSSPSDAGVAVLGVAGHGVADRLQVGADLVRAAGLEPHPQQRVAVEHALGLEVGDRGAAVGGVGRHAGAHAAVAAERRLDRAGAGVGAALDEREVLAHDLAPPQRALQRASGPPRSARPRAARSCRGRAGGRSRAAPRARRRRRARSSAWASVPAACPRAGCTTTPAGLSTTIRCSSSHAIEKRASGTSRGGLRLGLLDLDRLAAAQRVALGLLLPVDPHPAVVDQPLRRGARARVPGEEDVEPLARRVGRDLNRRHGAAAPRGRRAGSARRSVMHMSARLNAGHSGRSMKSVT